MRRQSGSIIRRGGSYTIVYRTQNGKQKWVGGFPNKASARAELNETLTQINKGEYVEPKPITFAEFAESYISNRISIRGSTSSAYASIIRKHLIPFFGRMKLQHIRLEHVQNFVALIAEGVSTKTLRNAVTLLRVMLYSPKGCSARRQGFVRFNPVEGAELPSIEREQIVPPTVEQVWRLIDKAAELNSIGHAIIYLDAFTGLRRGEILALRFEDIDWFKKELAVNKALSKSKAMDGTHKWLWEIGPPKSRRSLRRVGLSDNVIQLLSGLKQFAYKPGDLIFRDVQGGFIDPDFFDERIFQPIKEAAGLESVRFHDLRHFFASMLISQGESAKYVSDQLGHASIQITFDTYGHLFPQSRAEASKKLEKRMLKGRKKPTVSSLLANDENEDQKEESPGRLN
jgi:integrase